MNAPNIIISTGAAEDVASIMPIMNMAFDPIFGEAWNGAQCLSMLAMPYTHLWIAQSNDNICGFAFTRAIYENVELLMIATHPEYRRQSIAQNLMHHIIKDSICNDRCRIFLEMRKGNIAEKLYDKFGFIKIGIRKNYYNGASGQSYDAITKELIL